MALKAYDELNAYEAEFAVLANEELKAYEAEVALFANEAVPNNDPVMLGEFNDPVIETLPVNSWVLVNNVPKRVDPVTKSMLEVMVWATIVCAVNVPLTKKLSAEEAVDANEALTAFRT